MTETMHRDEAIYIGIHTVFNKSHEKSSSAILCDPKTEATDFGLYCDYEMQEDI